ncbi:MAG: NADH-quinone oxidoreductase subunit NuoH [Deltaproteobacteria bacterium]|nr:NADH-quinone oxidoreductase subunit NuoH [Deltaproteobacteria bacterium]
MRRNPSSNRARAGARSALLVFVAFLAMLVGCKRTEAPNLLDVVDVVPRDVEVGDHLEVLGTRLPASEAKSATVTFDGKLFRPGASSEGVDAHIVIEGAKPAADKVSVVLSEALVGRFCGFGDEAIHTTFRGDVTVQLDASAADGQAVQGRVVGVTVDFRAPSIRRIALEHRAELGNKVLTHLGVRIDDAGSPLAGGLRVAGVTAAGPADKAGVATGDLLVSWNGVTLLSVGDIVPAPGARLAQLGIKRGSGTPELRQVSMSGFEGGSLPNDILAAALILGVAAAVLLLFMAPTAGIITWVERRVSARMQSRVGPNRAGPQGFIVWMADGIKSIVKEDIIPTESDEPLFRLAPYLVFIGVSATFVVMPFGQYLIAADLDVGILFVVAVTSLVAIGLMTGGWASNNKWSLLGGVRAAAQVISYEIPAAVSIVCIVMMTGSLRMQDIIQAQGGLGDMVLAKGGWPWYWFVFKNPVSFALFFLFFTTALAEGNRAPFDLPEAESELVAGYSTEYSGMRYLFFFFAEWANVFVFCGIATALFLGGWQLPGVTPADQEASLALQLGGVFFFLLKAWILIFVVVWIRWTLPRVRIDQLMNLCWKWFVPMSFAAFLLTALWVLGTSPSTRTGESGLPEAASPLIPLTLQTAVGVAMFGVAAALVLHFARRVAFNLRESKQPIHVNPFI